jgi:hypothetical protein
MSSAIASRTLTILSRRPNIVDGYVESRPEIDAFLTSVKYSTPYFCIQTSVAEIAVYMSNGALADPAERRTAQALGRCPAG